jgi:hypothetical protein
MHAPMSMIRAIAALLLTAAAASSLAQAPTTPLLVTVTLVKPEMLDQWLALQKNEVVPALKKAGVTEHTVYQTLLGDAPEFVSVRPLGGFAEFDGPDLLERGLGAEDAAELRAKLRQCIQSMHRHIENRRDDFYIDPGAAPALFASRYRTAPGRGQDYMNFIRTEMFPVMQKAKEAGTFSGLSITVSGHGGESGLITLNMHYPEFAPLDGPPPVAKTLGPEGTREFIAKGAGLIIPLGWVVQRRLADLSF